MAEGFSDYLQQAFSDLPPEVYAQVGTLILILKALGIVFIVYLVFLIIMTVLNIRRGLRIKRIDKTVQEINVKLDKALGKTKSGNNKPKEEKKYNGKKK